jgi:hypothetical protein
VLAAASPAADSTPADWLHDFFHSTGFLIFRNVGLLLLAVFWLAGVYWVYKDARRRVADPWLVGLAALVAIVPVVGPLVYVLVRPPEYRAHVLERELAIAEVEAEVRGAELKCPTCAGAVRADFLVCPVCAARLKEPCRACGAALEASWLACPACATPKAAPAPKRRRPTSKPRAEHELVEHLLAAAKEDVADRARASIPDSV